MMHEKLGCLGTFAGIAACVGAWLLYRGEVGGLLLLAPGATFVALRIWGASQRRLPPSVLFILSILSILSTSSTADTFTNKLTGEALEGILLGRFQKDGKPHLIVKTPSQITRHLPAADWRIEKEAPPPEPAARPAAPAGPAWAWPPVTYKDKPRDPAWLDKAYAYFKDRFTVIEDVTVDLAHPSYNRPQIGRACRIEGKVVQVLAPDALLVAAIYAIPGNALLPGSRTTRVIHISRVPTKNLIDGAPWRDTVAPVGTHRYMTAEGVTGTLISCRPIPIDPIPLTRAQFIELLGTDIELIRWLRQPVPAKERARGGPTHRERPIPVP